MALRAGNKTHSPKPTTPAQQPDYGKGNWTGWLMLVIFLLIMLPAIWQSLSAAKEITWQEFERDLLSKNAVERIEVINHETAEIYLRKDLVNDSLFHDVLQPQWVNANSNGPHYSLNIGSVETFERKLEQAQQKFSQRDTIPVNYIKRSGWFWNLTVWVLPLFFFLSFGNTCSGGYLPEQAQEDPLFLILEDLPLPCWRKKIRAVLPLKMWQDWKKPKLR